MALARPDHAWRYALLTTVASVLGGVLGYVIGLFLFEQIEPFLIQWGYWGRYQQVGDWFTRWGFWAIFLAGFSPVPYKLFTIGAGAISMAFAPFVLASVIGRGARFFLVATLMRWGGARMEKTLRIYIDRLGWIVVALVIVGYWVVRH